MLSNVCASVTFECFSPLESLATMRYKIDVLHYKVYYVHVFYALKVIKCQNNLAKGHIAVTLSVG